MRVTYQPVLALVALSAALAIQVKADEKAGRLSGNVVNLSKEKSEITVRKETESRIVEYSAATKFNAGSPSNPKTAEPATPEDVKLGNYLTCEGSWDGVKLAAKVCTVRTSKNP